GAESAGQSALTAGLRGAEGGVHGHHPDVRVRALRGRLAMAGRSPGGGPGRAGRAALPTQPRALHEPSANTLRSHHRVRRRGTQREGGAGGLPAGARLLQPRILGLSPGLSESARRSASRALDPERCPPDHRTVADSSGGEAGRGAEGALHGAYRELLTGATNAEAYRLP